MDRFNEEDDGNDDVKQRRAKSALSSSLKSGRDIKDVEGADDDWEHSEDSDEEAERRKYEHESGIKVEAFNMDMEREEGHFDAASGHYVEDKFKMSQRDAWLEEVTAQAPALLPDARYVSLLGRSRPPARRLLHDRAPNACCRQLASKYWEGQ